MDTGKVADKSKKAEKAVVEVSPQQKRKENLEILLKSRFFYIAAYEIYGGVSMNEIWYIVCVFLKH